MKILIIDDDRAVCSSLKLLLTRKGYKVAAIHHPKAAIDNIQTHQAEIIILDMNFTIDTSGQQGLKLLESIRVQYPQISVVLMTGWATVQLAVNGMKLGAKDFVAKPWNNKDLLASLDNIKKLHHSTATVRINETSNIIGDSPQMQKILNLVERVSSTEASVLITGESGTGKELIAEAIHQKSARANKPFVKVNLGGISSNLFESEMFGHKKGAFTGAYNDRIGRFEKAHAGTIFLDEIGELALADQVKLLRVLQEKTYEKLGSSTSNRTDVRVICATNRNLEKMTDESTFREDLYYRINLINIHLPSLTERQMDIPALVQYFLGNVSSLYNTQRPYLDQTTYQWLSNQTYKGNIRQLKNIVERTFLLNLDAKELTHKDFLPAFHFATPSSLGKNTLNLQNMEIDAIKKALNRYNHSISAASKALGITRSSLYRRIEKYKIPYEPKI